MLKKYIIVVILFLMLFTVKPTLSYAYDINSNYNDYLMISNNTEQYADIKESISLSDLEDNKYSINTFDISNNGKILVCLQKNTINVYGKNNEFVISISLKNQGKIESYWQNELIFIRIIRADIGVLLDIQGNIVNMYNIKEYFHNSSENQKIFNANDKEYLSHKYSVGGNEFVDFINNGYSRLVLKNGNEEKIIYENQNALLYCSLKLISVFLFFVFFIFVVKKASLNAKIKK